MHLNKFGVLTCSDFQRFGCNAVENKLVEVRLIWFCSEGGKFCQRSTAKAGRAHGYC